MKRENVEISTFLNGFYLTIPKKLILGIVEEEKLNCQNIQIKDCENKKRSLKRLLLILSILFQF